MWMAFSDALVVPRPQGLCSTPPQSQQVSISAAVPPYAAESHTLLYALRAHLACSGIESTEGPLEWPAPEASAAVPPAVDGLEDGLLAEAVLRSSGVHP